MSLQSVVVTVFNVAQWLDEALESILLQSFTGTMEISIFNDASTVCIIIAISVLVKIQTAGFHRGYSEEMAREV